MTAGPGVSSTIADLRHARPIGVHRLGNDRPIDVAHSDVAAVVA